MPKTKKYEDDLLESLKDHKLAIAYLNAALVDVVLGEQDAQKILLIALRRRWLG